MSNQQIENSFFEKKVNLRIQFLPEKHELRVLDCYSADGLIWKEIIKRTNRRIKVVSIDKRKGLNNNYLIGDNLKFLKSFDLDQFDIIDLDAYGIPFEQLEIIFKKKLQNKRIYMTYIQTKYGQLNKKLLIRYGYTKRMLMKAKTIFNRNPLTKLFYYLAAEGIKSVSYYALANKNYLTFLLE